MDSIFSTSVTQVIKQRHSVRNYADNPIAQDILKKLEDYLTTVDNPFGQKIRIQLITKDNSTQEFKLGTYGVIKGARYFLAAACENTDQALIALGYTLEKVILYCTSLGLGTVWLGGTFNKGEFAKAMHLKEDEILPIVSPIGYQGGKKSFIATLIGENTNKRKPYHELFFNQNFSTPLASDVSDVYFEPLEMLRIAPSALNKQPWRVVREEYLLHFYLASNKGLTKIDIGIALCHFHLTAIQNHIQGKFITLDASKYPQNKDFTYIMSWTQSL